MSEFLSDNYNVLKSFHVISAIAWMAGLLYLPRLFIYHNDAENETLIGTFKIMERRLLKAIMNPAMIATWIFGLLMVFAGLIDWQSYWPWIKLLMILGLTWFHMWCAKHRKIFDADQNSRATKYYRYMNEVPTLLMIVIVFLVFVEPF